MQKTQAQPPTVPASRQEKSGMNVIVILVILFLLCICCSITCFAGLTLAFNATATAVKESVNETICAGSDVDIAEVYLKSTTNNFRSTTTLAEFRSMTADLQAEVCSDLENLDIITLIKNQWNVSYDNENGEEVLNITGKVNNKSIIINMVTEGEDLKIDKITIND